jgi:hypothetical protein
LSELSAAGGTIKSLQRQQRYLSPASRVNSAATASTDEKRALFIWKKKITLKKKIVKYKERRETFNIEY